MWVGKFRCIIIIDVLCCRLQLLHACSDRVHRQQHQPEVCFTMLINGAPIM